MLKLGIDGNDPEMEQQKFAAGCDKIKFDMPGFSYIGILKRVVDDGTLKSLYDSCINGHEKLQVCRLIDHEENIPIIEKFIKQTYHIENEFICQLDPARFDTIPEYVITECDKIVAGSSL